MNGHRIRLRNQNPAVSGHHARRHRLRRHKEFHNGAASWTRVERIDVRFEVSAHGADTRFVVTNLVAGSARTIYEDLQRQRGHGESHIKAGRRHLAADSTSCCRVTANQYRLMLHTGAYGCCGRCAA